MVSTWVRSSAGLVTADVVAKCAFILLGCSSFSLAILPMLPRAELCILGCGLCRRVVIVVSMNKGEECRTFKVQSVIAGLNPPLDASFQRSSVAGKPIRARNGESRVCMYVSPGQTWAHESDGAYSLWYVSKYCREPHKRTLDPPNDRQSNVAAYCPRSTPPISSPMTKSLKMQSKVLFPMYRLHLIVANIKKAQAASVPMHTLFCDGYRVSDHRCDPAFYPRFSTG